MKNRYAFVFALFLVYFGNAQEITPSEPLPRNTVFVEGLGNGLFGSVNYERQLTKTHGLSLRAGLGIYAEDGFYLTFPISLQFQFRLKQFSYLDLGLGYTFADSYADDVFGSADGGYNNNLHNFFMSVSYREVFSNNWMWKVSFTPLITNNMDVWMMPWVGIAFGKMF